MHFYRVATFLKRGNLDALENEDMDKPLETQELQVRANLLARSEFFELHYFTLFLGLVSAAQRSKEATTRLKMKVRQNP